MPMNIYIFIQLILFIIIFIEMISQHTLTTTAAIKVPIQSDKKETAKKVFNLYYIILKLERRHY